MQIEQLPNEMPYVWSLIQGKESYDLLALECQVLDEFIRTLKEHVENPIQGFESVLKFIVRWVSDLKCTNIVRGLGSCASIQFIFRKCV